MIPRKWLAITLHEATCREDVLSASLSTLDADGQVVLGGLPGLLSVSIEAGHGEGVVTVRLRKTAVKIVDVSS